LTKIFEKIYVHLIILFLMHFIFLVTSKTNFIQYEEQCKKYHFSRFHVQNEIYLADKKTLYIKNTHIYLHKMQCYFLF
jgi:hypothetical protein